MMHTKHTQESESSSLLHYIKASNFEASLDFAFDYEGPGVIRSNISIVRPWPIGRSSVCRDPYHLFLSDYGKNHMEP